MIIAAITMMSVVTLALASMLWTLRKQASATAMIWAYLALGAVYLVLMVIVIIHIIG